jgi:hypothetical protein
MRLLILFLFASLAHGAITAGTGGGQTTHASTTTTATVTITAGNAVFAVVSFQGTGSGCGSATLSVATNGSGNVNFTQDGSLHSRDYVCTGYFYLLNAASATSVTATSNAARDQLTMALIQFSGVATSGAVDVTTTTSRTFDSSGAITSASFSTSSANQVIVCGTSGYYTGTYTAGNIGSSTGTLGGTTAYAATIYRIVSSTQSSITAELTFSGTPYNNIGCISMTEAAGGGGGPRVRRVIVQ